MKSKRRNGKENIQFYEKTIKNNNNNKKNHIRKHIGYYYHFIDVPTST